MPGGAPTPQDIGLPQIGGPRQVAGYDVSGYAQGAEALARSGQQLGAGIEHAGQEIGQEEMYRARNQALLTQDQLLGDAIQYRDQAKRNPALTPDEYNAGLDELVNKHIANVPAGPMRDHALARTQIPIAREKASFNDQYTALQANDKRADFIDRINQLQNSTTWEPNPLHESQVQILAQQIGEAKDQGFLRPTEAEHYWRSLGNGVYYEHYRKGIAQGGAARAQAEAELEAANTAGMKTIEGLTPAQGGGFTFTGVPHGTEPAPSNLPHTIAGSVSSVASRYGVDPATLSRAVQIESGGNPSARTGSYKGILQLSQDEFDRYKPRPDASIWNADDNLAAGAAKMKAEGGVFAQTFGHQPSGFDSYMIHQQGLAGYSAHLANPNAPAWQNMLSTAEGQQKGAGWARQAVWDNVPTQYKIGFGNVDNVASREFLGMWQHKWAGGRSGAAPQSGGTVVDFPSGEARGDAMTGNSAQDTLSGAQIQTLLRTSRAMTVAESVDQERFQREQEKAERFRVESVKDEYHKDIFGSQPTKTLMQAESDPRLDGYPEAREWIRVAFERAGRGDPVHTTSQKTSNEFERRMDLAWGDPEKLTDIAEIRKAHYGDPATGVAPTLSNSDAEHLEKRFNDMRTGDGNTWNQNLGEVMKAVTPKVEKLPIPLGLVDTDAAERMYKFRRKVEDLRQQYIKANKDPSDLLNPNKPDYVGRQEFIQPFAADRNKLIAKLTLTKSEELKDEKPGTPLPAAPEGVDKKAWSDVMSRPPLKDSGKPWPHDAWAQYLDFIRTNNDPDDKAEFNAKFGKFGLDYDQVMGRLGGKPAAPGPAPTAVHGPSAATAAGALTGSAPGPVTAGAPAIPPVAPLEGAKPVPPAPPENETPEARRQRFETEAGVEAQRRSAEETQQRVAREARLAETRRAAQEQITGRKTMRAHALTEGAQAFNERRAADAARAHLDELGRQEALLSDNIKTWRAQQEDRGAAPGDRNRAALRADKLESELAAVRAERAKLK